MGAFVDPTAIVSADAKLGDGVRIWNWTKVREKVAIGPGTSVGQSCYIDTTVIIGARCKIQNGVSVYQGVTIGDDVFVGPNATFTNDKVPRAHSTSWTIGDTLVENGSSIGANATIVCGVRLGENCMVAAGALVTRDVPPHALVMGAPARICGYVERSGRRIDWDPADGPPPQALLDGRQE